MSKPYACLIVDDELPGRDLIAAHLTHLPQFRLLAACADAIEAGEVLANQSVDLMFLDIEMPTMKGTDFYLSLPQPPPVIFTTAYRDYAVEGFELDAVDYLLKPIVFERFFKATQRFLSQVSTSSDSSTSMRNDEPGGDLFVRVDRKSVRLRRGDILYVRSMGDYQEVHTLTEKHMLKSTISGFAEKLGPGFLRTHRSYLVNRHHISSVSRHEVQIGAAEVPISDAYRDVVFAMLGAS